MLITFIEKLFSKVIMEFSSVKKLEWIRHEEREFIDEYLLII